MPRRFDYQAPPSLPTPPADLEASTRVVPLRFTIDARRPGGVLSPVTVDPARFATPVLARQLGRAWVARFEGETEPRHGTVTGQRNAVADLLKYCARAGAAGDLSCRSLTAEFLHDWQDDMAARNPPGRSGIAGMHAGVVFALLRSIAAADPTAVAPGALARAKKRASHPSDGYSEALAEFTTSDLRRLIPAAISGVWATERRIEAGRALTAVGGDPRLSGCWTFANVVWLAAAGELTHEALKEHLPSSWRRWDDSLMKRTSIPPGGDRRGNIGELVVAAYRYVYPEPLDLVGHLVLIALDTAAWPEGVKDLTLGQARALTGGIGVELTKNRLPGAVEKLLHDAGNEAPAANRFRDTGTVLRSLLDVTEAARTRCGSDMVFVAGLVRRHCDGMKVGPVDWSGTTVGGTVFNQWVVANGLDRRAPRTVRKASGDEAVMLAAVSTPWDLRRLRKATLSHYGVYHPDEMAAWRDNTLAVFQEHYVAGSVVLKTRLGALARQAATDMADMVTSRTGFTVIRPDAADELRDGTSAAAVVLRLDLEKLRRLATGELDVDGAIAACTDLDGSPFAAPGELCRGAKLGLCLTCPNAVITPDHVPGLRRFDDEVIEEHRRSLDPVAFAHRWVPIRRSLRWALAQLGEERQR